MSKNIKIGDEVYIWPEKEVCIVSSFEVVNKEPILYRAFVKSDKALTTIASPNTIFKNKEDYLQFQIDCLQQQIEAIKHEIKYKSAWNRLFG